MIRRKRSINPARARRTLRRGEGIALAAAVCAAGGAEAQENAPAEAAATTTTTLPPQVVEAAPAPKPAPRPAPKPAPAPAPAPVIEPEPLVLDDALYHTRSVSMSKYTMPLRDVPQSVQVIPERLIKDQAATSLRDVLKNTPGITVQGGEGGGGFSGDNFIIRGFQSRSDIFIDGVRDYGIANRDPFNYEQIEVYKGPSSANSGRGSTGGSVNMVTKAPKLESFTRIDASTSLISGEHLYRTTLDINQPLYINRDSSVSGGGKGVYGGKQGYGGGKTVYGEESGAAFRLNLLYHDQEVPGRDYVEAQRWGVAPSIAFGLGTDTRLTLSYLHLEEDNIPDHGIPWAGWQGGPLARGTFGGVNYDHFYGYANYDFEYITNDLVSIKFEHDFSDDLQFRNFTRWGRSHSDRSSTRGGSAGRVQTRTTHGRDFLDEIFSNTSEFTYSFDTGSVGHTVVAGLELSQQDVTHRPNYGSRAGRTTPLFSPRPFDIAPPLNAKEPAEISEVGTTSLYLFDTIDLTEHWQYSGGLRYDHLDTDYLNTGTNRHLSRTDDLVSWRSALNFKPVENGSIYVAYSTSFDPSIEQNLGVGLEDRYGVDHSKLDPEESNTIELGTKWDLFDDRLALSGAIFKTKKTNARSPSGVAGVYDLTGGAEVEGFELGLAGDITERLHVYAGYTYLQTEVTSAMVDVPKGNELGNVPDHSLSLWASYDITPKLQVGAGMQYVGQRWNDFRNSYYLDDYVTVDAMVGYKVNENLSLQLNVRNMFDERYEDRPARGYFIPGEGRSVVLSASLQF